MATNSARFTKHLTEKEREALLRAVVIDRLSVAEAIRRAPLGQLGVPAFTIGTGAYGLVRDHRAEYEAKNPAARDLAIDNELERIVALALKNSRKITADSTPEERTRVAKELAAVKQAARGAGTRFKATNPRETKPDAVNTQRETTSTVADLLNLVPSGAKTGSLTDAPNT